MCVAVLCSVVQRDAVCCSVVQFVGWLWLVGSRCVLQCVAVWCSVVQCGAVWCSVMQCGAV